MDTAGAGSGSVVVAEDLGLRTRRGWVYRDVTCRVGPGQVAAVVGPSGSGRTSLLLALGGRMAFTSGALAVCGERLPGGARVSRARAAVARAGDVVDLDPDLRVRDHVAERRDHDLRRACERLRLAVDPKAFAGDLGALDATLLSVALALLDGPDLVLLDDVDHDLPGADQAVVWDRLRLVADTGTAVVATTTDPAPAAGRTDVTTTTGGADV